MLKKLTLSMQISAGYALVLILLVVVAYAAYLGLGQAVTGFQNYRELARDSVLAGKLESEMLLLRLLAKDYLVKYGDEQAKTFDEHLETVQKVVDTALTEIQKPDRAALVKEIDEDIDDYNKAFQKVVEFMHEREQVVSKELDPNGAAMASIMSEIMKTTYEDGDPDGAYFAGQVLESMLLGRLFVAKFLTTNENEDAQRAHTEIDSNLAQRLQVLDNQLKNPQQRALLGRFTTARTAYAGAMDKIHRIITDRNKVIVGEMDRIGPRLCENSNSSNNGI